MPGFFVVLGIECLLALFSYVERSPTASLLEDLCRDGSLARLYHELRKQVPSVPIEDVQDAVGHAVVETLATNQSAAPQDLAAYLFISAKRRLVRTIAERNRLPIADVDPDTRSDGSQAEQGFDCKDLFNFLKRLVARWDNERMRTIVGLVLDAALEGVSMTGLELAQQAEDLTGEPFSLSSVYDWKSRGLRRLHDELEGSVQQGGQGDSQNEQRQH